MPVGSVSALGLDLNLVDPKSSQAAIIRACAKEWFEKGPNGRRNWADCSGFVKAVQKELSLRPFSGDANGIFDELERRSDWQVLGTGPSAGAAAGNAANQGFLTIAVWKNLQAGENGHVAIITSYLTFVGATAEQHAIGAWGKLGSVGRAMDRMTQSFGPDKRPAVRYAKCLTRPFF